MVWSFDKLPVLRAVALVPNSGIGTKSTQSLYRFRSILMSSIRLIASQNPLSVNSNNWNETEAACPVLVIAEEIAPLELYSYLKPF